MSKILSFDVSSVSTGWAFLFGGKLQEFGVIQPQKAFRLQEKLCWFKGEVNSLLRIYEPDYILVEEVYLKNVKTLKVLMQFIGVINLECFQEASEEPLFLSPQTVRSMFGLKNKEEVFEFIKKKYKVKFKNIKFEDGNDMSDAVLQALYWQNVLEEKPDE